MSQHTTPPADNKTWLNAWHDPIANLKAFSPNVRLADIHADNAHKLLVATQDKKLKVYHGTALLSENVLLDTPAAIAVFHPELRKPKTPSVAVAAGQYIFIYRNLRPYYKFVLPELQLDERERHAWERLADSDAPAPGADDLAALCRELKGARDAGARLTARSVELLSLSAETEAALAFIESCRHKRLASTTCVTCMEVLNKDQSEPDAVSMLVLGTEAGQVHILEPSASTVAHTFQLPSAPAFIVASGLKAVEYRVICACRDGRIYTIKNGELTGTVIEMESLPCALARIEKSIYVACTTSVVHAFSLKGRRQYTLFLPSPALCMDVVEQTRPRNVRALLLGLANGELRLYADKSLISTVQLGEPVAALRFGCYGREDGALVVVGASGALSIKMLHRKANLEAPSVPPGPPREQDIPLSIPRKTKLYVEHTQREREIAIDMHRVFQRDLCKLRLSTARAYVKLLSDGKGQVSFSPSASLRLAAQVQGLGPRFCIKLTLQNTGRQAAHNLGLSLHHDANILKLESAARRLPVLVPGISLRLEVRVQRLKEAAGSDEIRVLVNSSASALPLMSAIVSIPASEKLLR